MTLTAILTDQIDFPAEIERLRLLAEEARTTAADMKHPPSREAVLRIAEGYDRLATALEDTFKRGKPISN